MTSKTIKKKYIDTIRALSVCIVVLYHFFGQTNQFGFSIPILTKYSNGTWGAIGVFLFFMISGNLLMHKYQDDFNIKKFYANRFFRIFPMFWLCYTIFFLVNFWKSFQIPNLPLYKIIYTVFGMDGYFLYKIDTFYILGEWFLGCIILIYLLFPLIRKCINLNIHITLGILFILSSLIYYNNFFNLFEIAKGRNLIVALFYFVLGVWIERILTTINKKIMIYCILGILLILSGFIIGYPLPIEHLGYIILTCTIFLLIFTMDKYIKKNNVAKNLIETISRNSYVIFLIHHVIIVDVTRHFSGNLYSFKSVFCIFVICISLIFILVAIINKIYKILSIKK